MHPVVVIILIIIVVVTIAAAVAAILLCLAGALAVFLSSRLIASMYRFDDLDVVDYQIIATISYAVFAVVIYGLALGYEPVSPNGGVHDPWSALFWSAIWPVVMIVTIWEGGYLYLPELNYAIICAFFGVVFLVSFIYTFQKYLHATFDDAETVKRLFRAGVVKLLCIVAVPAYFTGAYVFEYAASAQADRSAIYAALGTENEPLPSMPTKTYTYKTLSKHPTLMLDAEGSLRPRDPEKRPLYFAIGKNIKVHSPKVGDWHFIRNKSWYFFYNEETGDTFDVSTNVRGNPRFSPFGKLAVFAKGNDLVVYELKPGGRKYGQKWKTSNAKTYFLPDDIRWRENDERFRIRWYVSIGKGKNYVNFKADDFTAYKF